MPMNSAMANGTPTYTGNHLKVLKMSHSTAMGNKKIARMVFLY